MSKYSAGMTLQEIHAELVKAVCCSLTNIKNHKEAYTCLEMVDKMLPQNLGKLMRQLLKNLSANNENMQEVAAIKCVIDFRLCYYSKIGRDRSKYLLAAVELHKRLTARHVTHINEMLRYVFQKNIMPTFVVL